MALASYGKDKYAELFSKLVRIDAKKKTLKINTKVLDYHAARNGSFSKEWLKLTDMTPRMHGEPITQEHMDLAYSLQKCLETSILTLLKMRFNTHNERPLCVAGGIFLNSVLNGKIIVNFNENLFVLPAAGDNGVSVGAALYCNAMYNNNYRKIVLNDTFLGKEFDNKDILAALQRNDTMPKKTENKITDAGKLILQGKIVGWYQRGWNLVPEH